ncbi:MAG: trypsin-like peptidase domain-containing protein [candidate division NC10 bacterium]|nr:trypsin-like peptidase domain-containing protein [candidate division NC10 bacterium]
MIIHHFWFGRPRAMGTLAFLLLITWLVSCSTVREGMAAEQPKEARCPEATPDIFERVAPAVVFITATSINPYEPFDRVEHSVGSGIVFDRSGLILTNAHVVFGRQAITVSLDDGTSLPAELVGADPIFDVAVLRIPSPSEGKLPTAALGDSDRVRVGEEVLAIGNPLGLDQTLTRGIVSAINRILPETPFSLLEPLIQTDTPINPGNSGGPLLNRCGEVIGLTTAVIPEAQNIGFAIPINLAKAVLPSLIAQGQVIRPWLGFHGQLVDEALQGLLRIPLVEGLLVEVVEPGSPAERAGLRGGQLEVVIAGHAFLVGGDIITSVNGTSLISPNNLIKVMRGLKVGVTVHLTVVRDGKDRTVEYVLPERPLLPGDFPGQRLLAPVTGRGVQPALPRGSWSRTR